MPSMRWLLLVLLVVSSMGCRKKSAPEVYGFESDIDIAVARNGDEAWESPELEAIEAKLAAISPEVLEAPLVQALLTKLRSERARVRAEREELERESAPPTAAANPFGADPGSGGENGEAPAAADGDGGVLQAPALGMSEEDFLKAFGACFSSGPSVDVPDAGRGSSQVVLGRPECEQRFGEKGSTVSYVFVDGKLSGRRFEGPPTIELHDAGPPPPRVLPPPPTPFDAGTLLSFPGAPRPENMSDVPGSPGSKIP